MLDRRCLFTCCFPALLAVQAGAADIPAAGDYARTLISGGYTRNFLMHVPPQAAAGQPLPLIIALHGGYGDGRAMARMTQFSPMADTEGFVVVYPDGLHAHWADGRGTTWPDTHGVDDVAFISALIADCEAFTPVDHWRVYATGISNGGMMCERLGLELGSKIAAIAPVAGSMPTNLASTTRSGRPAMPVVLFNGTADTKMPYGGGDVDGGGTVLSVDDTVGFWRQWNDVARLGDPTVIDLPDTDPTDGCTVVEFEYPGGLRTTCDLYEIVGGGHTWPGQPKLLINGGPICRDISASATIWSFFLAHPKSAADENVRATEMQRLTKPASVPPVPMGRAPSPSHR